MRSPDEEVDERLDRPVRPGQLADLGVDRLPLTRWEHREAFVHPTGHDRSFFEAGSELCGDRQPTLLVQRVGEFAGKVRFQLACAPFRSRDLVVPHQSPLLTTRAHFHTTGARCQEAGRRFPGRDTADTTHRMDVLIAQPMDTGLSLPFLGARGQPTARSPGAFSWAAPGPRGPRRAGWRARRSTSAGRARAHRTTRAPTRPR